MSLKIVFMGTPEFSLPALKTLVKNKFNILKIYTQSPKKSKRGQKINISPIQAFSEKNKLNFRNPENLNSSEEYEIFNELSEICSILYDCVEDAWVFYVSIEE